MTDLTPSHPAVEAAGAALRAWMADLSDALPDDMMVYVLTAALPHLTADDLPTRLVRDIQVRTIRAAADGAPVSAWLNGLADNIEAGSA